MTMPDTAITEPVISRRLAFSLKNRKEKTKTEIMLTAFLKGNTKEPGISRSARINTAAADRLVRLM